MDFVCAIVEIAAWTNDGEGCCRSVIKE